jgi:alkylation response protein AidB-like acyl-CoA dehydrogenase
VIDLVPDAGQLEIVSNAAGFLRREGPRLRAGEVGQASQAALLRACANLGWLSLTLPAECGGSGLALIDECLVFRELGRHLASGAFLASSIGARLAHTVGETELASRIALGASLVGIAELADAPGRVWWWADEQADFVLIVDIRGKNLRLVKRDMLDVSSAVPTIDPHFQLIEATIGQGAATAEVAGHAAQRLNGSGSVLAAAMLTGIAEYARDESVGYASIRIQFGRPIGVQQAVKHRCADMGMRAEAAWSQTCWAALVLDSEPGQSIRDVSAAKAVAARAAVASCGDNIQNHGGIGYTAGHDAHLYLKRAHIFDRLFGTTDCHLDRVLAADPAP